MNGLTLIDVMNCVLYSGMMSEWLRLFIFEVEPINFLTPLEDITLNDLGLKAEFSCTITKSNMKAQWFKGDVKVKKDGNHEMVSDGQEHRLVINKAQVEDEAQYTVVFREDVKTSATLTIKGQSKTLVIRGQNESDHWSKLTNTFHYFNCTL